MKTKPGEVFDKHGIPIYPGDLLRTFHFRGKRRKIYYLYHVAVWDAKYECMSMVPVSYLEPTRANRGGQCWLSQGIETEIIDGTGPGDFLCHTERPKWK
jgi:hypothetical protein